MTATAGAHDNFAETRGVQRGDGIEGDGPGSFGELLRDLRLAAGLSQEALAERARMSPAGISVLERGLRRSPYRDTVALLADGLALCDEDRARLEAAAARPTRPRRRTNVAHSVTADSPRRHNVPHALTSFVGREVEVAEIVALVRKAPMVTIVGTGGVGKTRTAFHVGSSLLDDFEAGVWVVDLAPLNDGSRVAHTIANTLGIPESTNRSALDAALAYLARKDLLLILDNCEHLIADAAVVASAITLACPGTRVLATSREPLKIRGEHVCRLGSLPMPSAIELFVARATAIDHRFILTDESVPTVANICRRLDGIPLAIELAAARVGVLPLKTLAEKLDRRFIILTGGSRVAMRRQQTLRALIDWSYDLLTPAEQRLFERLSVFAGGCTLEFATRVCADDELDELGVLERLASLVDKSLVVAHLDEDEPRYSLLESQREYAREKLAMHGEGALTAHRHAQAYCELAERIEEGADIAAAPGWPDEFEAELENWRAALAWTLLDRTNIVLGQRLAGMLRPVWTSEALGEGRRWVRTALNLVDETTPIDIVALLEFADARLALRFGENQGALDTSLRALGRYRALGDRRRIAGALNCVAHGLLGLGRVREAELLLREGLDEARALGLRWLCGFLIEQIVRARALQGDRAEAQVYYAEALTIFRTVGDERNALVAAGNLAETEFRAGDVAAALRVATGALREYRKLDEVQMYAVANVAAYLVAMGEFDEAHATAVRAIELGREQSQHVAIACALQHLAAVAAMRPIEGGASVSHDRIRAAHLVGFVDKALVELGAPRQFTEQDEYDRVLFALCETFDVEQLVELMAAGAAMTEDQAIEEAYRIQGRGDGL